MEISGVVLGHSDGYGFLRPDIGKEDFYLSPTEMLKVMHGDQVVVKINPGREKQRTDAVILEVVKRAQRDLVGRLVFENGLYLVVPEEKRINHDIVVSKNNLQTAKIGQIVVVSLIDQPTKVTPPIGKIIEVVGDSDEPGIENEIALRKFKKSCERAGIVQEVRKREFYEKPSAKRQRKHKEAVARWRKKEKSLQLRPERRY